MRRLQRLKEKYDSIDDKYKRMSIDDKINAFIEEYDLDEEVNVIELQKWHRILTNSCLVGRLKFMKEHKVNDRSMVTVRDFIGMTKNDFGGDIIKKLEEAYNERRGD